MYPVGPEERGRGVVEGRCAGGVVDHGRVALGQGDVGARSVGSGDVVGEARDAVAYQLPGGWGEGAEGTADLGGFGDDVGRRARVDRGDGDHGRIEDVDGTRDHGLQGLDDLAGHGDGVEGPVWCGGVSAAAAYGHVQPVGGGEGGPRPQVHGAAVEARGDVQGERGRHAAAVGGLQHPLVDHVPGAPAGFLRGLEPVSYTHL